MVNFSLELPTARVDIDAAAHAWRNTSIERGKERVDRVQERVHRVQEACLLGPLTEKGGCPHPSSFVHPHACQDSEDQLVHASRRMHGVTRITCLP